MRLRMEDFERESEEEEKEKERKRGEDNLIQLE